MRGKRSPSDGTDASTPCIVVGRNTTAGMPPSSALSLPVSAAPARQLSRANRPRKRKSSAEQLSFFAPAAFANALHKTDGSYVNRLLFFLEEKTVGMRGKRSPSDGRTQAHPALSSVGIPQRVCLPPPPCLCPCPPRLRASFPVQTDHAKENHLRNSCFSALLLLSSTCYKIGSLFDGSGGIALPPALYCMQGIQDEFERMETK